MLISSFDYEFQNSVFCFFFTFSTGFYFGRGKDIGEDELLTHHAHGYIRVSSVTYGSGPGQGGHSWVIPMHERKCQGGGVTPG